MNDLPETTRDHWWWRPGWRLGRSYYTWHITFADQPDIRRLVADYARYIQPFPTLDLVSEDGLHLTIQGIGFVDEVSRSDMENIVEASQRLCSSLEPFTLKAGPAHVDAETVQMYAEPAEAIGAVRLCLRQAIGNVWGYENVPESMNGFRPHVTLAYSNGVASTSEIDASLRAAGPAAGTASISAVSLIELNRDRKRYEWSEIATVPLGVDSGK